MPLPNAPTPPAFNSSVAIFPSDLLQVSNPQGGPGGVTTTDPTVAPNATGSQTTASGGFYTQISVTAAENVLTGVTNGVGGSGGFANPQSGTSIYLPLPHNIEDVILSVWNDLAALDYVPIVNQLRNLPNLALRGGGAAQSVNPFLFMLYKQPLFRVFEFRWILAPNTPEESRTLMNIITYLKTASLPDYLQQTTLILDYPYIALPKLNPNQYLFDIKPCAIEAVQTDYTGANQGPSFFKDGSPTMVALTIRLKEIDILTRTDLVLAGRGGQLTNGMGINATGGNAGTTAGGAAGGAVGGAVGGGAGGAAGVSSALAGIFNA